MVDHRKSQRVMDVTFSLLGIVLLFPLGLVAAALVKLDSPGPVFFRQRRVGRHFRPFHIYKFRTMRQDADTQGAPLTAGGDPRVTRSGRVLRKWKIDELPQLLNVLKGDMSLVGPRPEMEKYVEIFRDDYSEILRVRPGLTDISSLVFRDEESVLKGRDDAERYYIDVLLPRKISMAKAYVESASFWLDVKLILKTAFRVLVPATDVPEQRRP